MLSNLEMLLRLALAAALGSVIGAERERLQWTAGLRTHMLVCVGAALFMIVSSFGFADALGSAHVVLDPSRVAAQVVSGIGFLGAGAILLRRDKIRGLTTAASLWTVAAIGLAVGGGLYVAAVGSTVIIFSILAGLKPLERRYWSARGAGEIVLTIDREAASLAVLEAELTTAGIVIRTVSILPGERPEEDEVTVGAAPAAGADAGGARAIATVQGRAVGSAAALNARPRSGAPSRRSTGTPRPRLRRVDAAVAPDRP